MIEENKEQLRQLQARITDFSNWKRGAGNERDADQLAQMSIKLDQFEGGHWFALWLEMHDEGNLFVEENEHTILWENPFEACEPEELFQRFVKDTDYS